MALTKAQIRDAIQDQLGLPKSKSTELIETFLELIKKTLEGGDDLLISGFGKFCVKNKRERRGRNPATGQDMMLAKRSVITFKCSGKLRDRINNKGK
ncbi:integration host factor subunit alpha [Thermodesulfobacteriota bacterium]